MNIYRRCVRYSVPALWIAYLVRTAILSQANNRRNRKPPNAILIRANAYLKAVDVLGKIGGTSSPKVSDIGHSPLVAVLCRINWMPRCHRGASNR